MTDLLCAASAGTASFSSSGANSGGNMDSSSGASAPSGEQILTSQVHLLSGKSWQVVAPLHWDQSAAHGPFFAAV